jgi:RNA-binding protein
MIELTPTQRRALRAAAHHLHPVVSVSHQGLTESVQKEIDLCLKSHQLIKVKLLGIEREEREFLLQAICRHLDCAAVQHIGNILVLWRENPELTIAPTAPAPRRSPAKPHTKKQAAAAMERPRRRGTSHS